MPREVSSPGLWRRLCSTKLSSQAPSTTFFHHMQSGLIPTVRNGVMAVLAAFLGAEWGGGQGRPPCIHDTGYCIQCSAYI